MRYYIMRIIIAGISGVSIVVLFFGGKHFQADSPNPKEQRAWIWPADGIVSDTFGTRQGKHKGIDIAGKKNSPIYAVDDGIVEKSYYSNSYGNVIFIHHQGNFVTVYAHLNSRYVSEGQFVKQEQIIGKMGSSGQATGVHLHFETHQSQWTYEKKFAFDPDGLLGVKKVGEVVQAGSVNREENALEASSRLRSQEENRAKPRGIKRNRHHQEYMVRRGDTLSSISRNKSLTVRELKKRNHLSSDLIRPGQFLIVK